MFLLVFICFSTEVLSWVAGRQPCDLTNADDIAQLSTYRTRNATFGDFIGHLGTTLIDHLRDTMF